MAGDSLALQSRDEMKVLARVRDSETVYWQRGVQVKVVAVSILAGFVRSSNYLYLAEKDECKTSLDSSRGKTRFSERALTLVMA